jgi:hypothetical protein
MNGLSPLLSFSRGCRLLVVQAAMLLRLTTFSLYRRLEGLGTLVLLALVCVDVRRYLLVSGLLVVS